MLYRYLSPHRHLLIKLKSQRSWGEQLHEESLTEREKGGELNIPSWSFSNVCEFVLEQSKRDGEETTGREEKEEKMAIRWEKKGSWLLSLGRDWSCTIWLSRVGGEFQDWSLPEDGHSNHLRSELPPFTLKVLLSWATQEWAFTVRGITNEGLSHDCECRKWRISSEKSQSVVSPLP